TSNLASDIIMKACSGPELPDVDDLVAQIRPVLSAHFKPALLARMTIIPYYPIGASVMADIVRLKLKSLGRRLMKSHKMELVLSDHVIRGIASLCTEAETGARNIDQLMNQALLPRISQKILTQMAEGVLPKQLVVGIDPEGYFTFEFSDGEATAA
ncbi:MAG: type VI secretion system ATPase TssH, partial [Myxococcales bacterium]|nr:type VI secretion system ATPase TssH [Myxococcales bacterium]